jgi:FHA domain containing protein
MDKSFLEPKDLDENIIALSEDMLSTTYNKVSDIERIKDKYGLTEQVAREVEEDEKEEEVAVSEANGELPFKENEKREVDKVSERPKGSLYSEEKTTFLGANDKNPILKNLSTGDVYEVTSNPFTIGKSQTCNLVIADKVVSRHHAEIVQYGDKYFIKDLSSTNGTFINGNKLMADTDVELKDGQEIIFANKKFVYHG